MEEGIPDLIVCIKGLFLGIEAKDPKGKQSLSQKVHQQNIENSGGIYILAKSLDDVIKIVKDL